MLLHLEILRLRRRRLQLHLGSSCDGLDPAVLVVSRMVGVMEQTSGAAERMRMPSSSCNSRRRAAVLPSPSATFPPAWELPAASEGLVGRPEGGEDRQDEQPVPAY